jgi:hypothetical protein
MLWCMKFRPTHGFLTHAATVVLVVGCSSDPSDASTSADPTATTTADPTSTSSPTSTADPSDGPSDTSTSSVDTSAGDPTDEVTSDDPSMGDSSSGSGTTGEPATAFLLDVEVDLGGVFDVAAEVTLTIREPSFTSDVVTVEIAGGPEEHQFVLSGSVVGDELTMAGSTFMIDVGGTPETHAVSGTVTLGADGISGGGTVESTIGKGPSIPGTWTVVGSSPL